MTGSTGSLWADRKSKPRMDLETEASSKVTKKNKQTKVEAAANETPAGKGRPFSTLNRWT